MSAATGIGASAPSYDYQTGPDGKKYAVGGEVSISVKQSKDPEVNLKNAQTMKTAALAPADPSSQDKSVAAQAEKLISEARQQIAEQKTEQKAESSDSTDDSTPVIGSGESKSTEPVEGSNAAKSTKNNTVNEKSQSNQSSHKINTAINTNSGTLPSFESV